MKRIIIDNAKTLIFAFLIALFIRTFFFQPFYIPSSSMEESLLVGDRLFVTKFTYGYSKHSLPFSPNISDKRILFSSPERGDVIVFKTPEDNDTDYIKRLIGLPGDKIQMLNGVLNINNKPIKREFIKNDFVLCGGTKIKSNFYQETLPNGKTYLAAYSEKNSSKASKKMALSLRVRKSMKTKWMDGFAIICPLKISNYSSSPYLQLAYIQTKYPLVNLSNPLE